jgi:hypothetical protein
MPTAPTAAVLRAFGLAGAPDRILGDDESRFGVPVELALRLDLSDRRQ